MFEVDDLSMRKSKEKERIKLALSSVCMRMKILN